MRTAGFPCRQQGCDQVFQVADQNSMPELHAASAARTAHEVAAHTYHHVSIRESTFNPYQRAKTKPAIPK
jgi:hypothetical protein